MCALRTKQGSVSTGHLDASHLYCSARCRVERPRRDHIHPPRPKATSTQVRSTSCGLVRTDKTATGLDVPILLEPRLLFCRGQVLLYITSRNGPKCAGADLTRLLLFWIIMDDSITYLPNQSEQITSLNSPANMIRRCAGM